MLYFMCYSKR